MRSPIVAGIFYPSDNSTLNKWIEIGISNHKPIQFNSISSLFVPNGDYYDLEDLYLNAYSNLTSLPSSITFILISNNKLKIGKPVSISQDDWFVPSGKVLMDDALAESIKKYSSFAEFDNSPHNYDPSIELQLPFINFISRKSKIVAITLAVGNRNVTEDIANAIEKAVEFTGKNVILISASQFLHCKSYEEGEAKLKKYSEIISKCNEFDLSRLIDLFSQEECMVNSSVFLIPFVYSIRKEFMPRILSTKIVKTGVKEDVDVFISIAYIK